MRMHCLICHSKAHTVEQCDYNMLNRLTPVVRRMEPQRQYRKNGRRITFGMQTEISAERAHSKIIVLAIHILRKKIKKMTNIGIIFSIIKGGIVTTIAIRHTIVGDSTGLAHTETTDNIGTNGIMTRVLRMTGARNHAGTNVTHPGITGECSKIGRSKLHLRIRIHRPVVERGESGVHCFVCQQPGHYARPS
mgnify:CR=1 FL=1